MSITPVREALIELSHRGMVTQVRNRGFRVIERSADDLDAALELRALVEIPMMARLAGTLRHTEIERFEQLVDAGSQAAEAVDLGAFLDLDRRFHLGLLRLAGNPHVVDVVDRVLDHLRLATFRHSRAGSSLTDVADGHREILAAITPATAPALNARCANTWSSRARPGTAAVSGCPTPHEARDRSSLV